MSPGELQSGLTCLLPGSWVLRSGTSHRRKKLQWAPQSWLRFHKMAAALFPGATNLSGDGSSQSWQLRAAPNIWLLEMICLQGCKASSRGPGSRGARPAAIYPAPPSLPSPVWAIGRGLILQSPGFNSGWEGWEGERAVCNGVPLSTAAHMGLIYGWQRCSSWSMSSACFSSSCSGSTEFPLGNGSQSPNLSELWDGQHSSYRLIVRNKQDNVHVTSASDPCEPNAYPLAHRKHTKPHVRLSECQEKVYKGFLGSHKITQE